ncbi:hypothetical protein I7G86_19445 [Sinorhizobium meliloti]|uniref:DUF3149 domain-containing protein n=1 Tax=Sinorhizobium meliloti (strain SM11) TaxID=707241 RepID=F7XAW9_SINMM|nr:hypothetical protein [Sinorhizobium meliloti]AEH81153.1 hypothetical protein SM11_pC0080 [Sinorhizobium meliloti SM11]MDE3763935.1 hypothetical protein [Sinorhizobium meliloti]MDE3776297.1 hypothetical protein [Sinorhizobium meliloti]MDE3779317.1 hypothetical protein [Sinorhizobium meliloti]MDE3792801.1 hypothetical protein [Sinorhizobium meliloti]
MDTIVEILKLLLNIPPDRLASFIALGVIALAMFALYVIHSLAKGRGE